MTNQLAYDDVIYIQRFIDHTLKETALLMRLIVSLQEITISVFFFGGKMSYFEFKNAFNLTSDNTLEDTA